jgi:hypothetical protein
MGSTWQLRLQRVDTAGEPAAMVATWVMGELTAFSAVSVAFVHPDVVTFDAVSATELAGIRSNVATLLREARFAHWVLKEG